MNKMQMAHEYMQNTLKYLHENNINFEFKEIVIEAFDYADAMQDESDKRKPSGLPEALHPEVDWRLAPSWAKFWVIRNSGASLWCTIKPTLTEDCLLPNGPCGPAPSFGFTGSHIVERPQ